MILVGFGISTSEASHISIDCAWEVGGSIFEDGSVTGDCCNELVSVGKTYHDLFFNSALAFKSNADKSEALAKSAQLWNRCVGIAVSRTSSIPIPTSKASKSKTMDECKKQISIKCAREVGETIFKGGSVADGCCYELVSVGKICHDLFFNSALESTPNVDKSRALAKSTQVWNRCVKIIISPISSISETEN